MNWQAKPIQHKNEQRIAVYFDNTPTLNARIKKLPDAKWSNSLKAWHVPDNAENRKRFQLSVISHQSSENTVNQSAAAAPSPLERAGVRSEKPMAQNVIDKSVIVSLSNHNSFNTDNRLPNTTLQKIQQFIVMQDVDIMKRKKMKFKLSIYKNKFIK